MNNSDFVRILGNISQSLLPIDSLIAGLAYLLGILFFMLALFKFKKVAAKGGGQDNKMFIPLAYLLGGSALLFLPSAITLFSYSSFGQSNPLQYIQYNPYNVYGAVRMLIQTAGLIWFVRGCVLLVHASEPGVQEGPKGLAFLVAGILAVNFEGTISSLNAAINYLMDLSFSSNTTT
ncbi:protein IcmC (DotV)-like protein (plasmid) [Legionella adelaidensis]|uniref:Protein IcmC (DotV)-like protein n=1 Tax=Legionella adelaidensis TaxID=45056 RepID=A0A0W0R2R7_9GAMM|nr:hypothetical protein [Legionella adelaidensis]KTC65376.1 protein IcmC (DotV)-like protein [Legionella adelaidensis]VEH84802.1 protein IcmC (DotV)-like protein [Legionella adelaidensis]